jgi:serine/threonine protein kinase
MPLATSPSPLTGVPTASFASDVQRPSEEAELLPVGFNLGNYVIRACVGRGSMGVVYRAEHLLLKKSVALKAMSASLLPNAEARQRFLREAQAAAAIKHPHVVDITDVGVDQGTPYLVMELLDGHDLEHHLEHQPPLTNQELVALALPLIAALGAAHDAGVVHRDLKPGNIFLARGVDGGVVPKLLDFGVSKFANLLAQQDLAATPFDQLLGSPLYLPPEALQGARALSVRSDQYSLAVVLYECVTGRPPFVGESLLGLLNAIAHGVFDPPRRVSPETSELVERVILRAMSADPDQRFDHIRDLGRDLLQVADLRTRTLWNPTFEPRAPTGGVARISVPQAVAPSVRAPEPSAPSARPLSSGPRPRAQRWGLLALAVLAVLVIWIAVGLNGRRDAPHVESSPLTSARRSSLAAPSVETAGPPRVVVVPGEPTRATAAEAADTALEPEPVQASAAHGAGSASNADDLAPPKRPEARPSRSANRARRVLSGPGRGVQRSTSTRRLPGQPARAEADTELEDLFLPPAPGPERVVRPTADEPPVANEATIFD